MTLITEHYRIAKSYNELLLLQNTTEQQRVILNYSYYKTLRVIMNYSYYRTLQNSKELY